jgi:methylated-DNA-[protein]-cysteine S-methyltransferase
MTARPLAGRRTHTIIDSPVGPITLLGLDGALAGLYLDHKRHPPPPQLYGEPDPEPFGPAVRQLARYFDGALTRFDLPLALAGTPFQQRVWTALQAIPYGTTMSYGQLAGQLGQPSAARAVGLANGRNPVSIVVPCHRLIGSDGGLTGYGGGLPGKRYLLDLERRVAAGSRASARPGSRADSPSADQLKTALAR